MSDLINNKLSIHNQNLLNVKNTARSKKNNVKNDYFSTESNPTAENIRNIDDISKPTFSNKIKKGSEAKPEMKSEKEINKNNSFLGKIKNTIRNWLDGFNSILSKIGLTTAKSNVNNDIKLDSIHIPKEIINPAKYYKLGFDKISNNDLNLLEIFSNHNREYDSYTENSLVKNTETGNKKHTFILGEKYPLSECVVNDLQRDKREYSISAKTLYNHGHNALVNLLNKDDHTVTNINPSKHFIDMVATLRTNFNLPENHEIAYLDSNGDVKLNSLFGERLKIAMCNN